MAGKPRVKVKLRLPSLFLRGRVYWYKRTVNGKTKAFSTHSSDKEEANAYLAKVMESELLVTVNQKQEHSARKLASAFVESVTGKCAKR